MGELGDRLRSAREAKSLSLDEAADLIRIQRQYLEALENESFGVFSSDLHARGFLRNYASLLTLDPAEMVDLYNMARGGSRRRSTQPPPPPPSPTRPEMVRAKPKRVSILVADIMLLFVGLSFLSVAGMYLYQRQFAPTPEVTGGPTPTPTVTPLPVFERTAYDMDVTLNYPEHQVVVRQKIDYTNVTSSTLSDLMFNVHPNRGRNVFKLDNIKVDVDGELVQPEVIPLDVTLRVVLPEKLPPGEHVTVFLNFTLNLPRIDPNAEFTDASFGYSKRSVSLGNWYPVLAPYREDKDGWYAMNYFQVGDPYVTEVADYHVTITPTQGVILAGTGEETREGGRWTYVARHARSFALAASDVYQVESADTSGGVTVFTYYFPGHESGARAALDTAVKALDLYAELYGPYPDPAFRVCETEFAGGLEFTGLAFIGAPFFEGYDDTARTALTPLVAHETAHQWFYALVGNDQVAEPWLDEALAEYSSFLYYERYLPGDTEWWWETEVRQWAAVGKIDHLIYQFKNNRDYMDAVYRRGSEFVHDLRTLMGDPAFFAFMQEYTRRNSYRLVRSRDFFRLVQEFSTADLMPLQEEYFRQRVLPE